MNRDFFKTTIAAGLPFCIVAGAFLTWKSGYVLGSLVGCLCGLLFGAAVAEFRRRQGEKLRCASGIFEGEPVLLEGFANHFLKGEGRGGWLIVTKSKLYFKSHGNNLQNESVEVSIADILEARPAKTFGLFTNRLLITKKSGEAELFIVREPNSWIAALR